MALVSHGERKKLLWIASSVQVAEVVDARNCFVVDVKQDGDADHHQWDCDAKAKEGEIMESGSNNGETEAFQGQSSLSVSGVTDGKYDFGCVVIKGLC
eukprot:4803315-Ditylum_brightwellii.AAC.2